MRRRGRSQAVRSLNASMPRPDGRNVLIPRGTRARYIPGDRVRDEAEIKKLDAEWRRNQKQRPGA
jgi:hypothetical protein